MESNAFLKQFKYTVSYGESDSGDRVAPDETICDWHCRYIIRVSLGLYRRVLYFWNSATSLTPFPDQFRKCFWTFPWPNPWVPLDLFLTRFATVLDLSWPNSRFVEGGTGLTKIKSNRVNRRTTINSPPARPSRAARRAPRAAWGAGARMGPPHTEMILGFAFC